MRVFKPIPSKLIPTAALGRPRNPRYDALIAHAQKLPVGQAYPVECSDHRHAVAVLRSLANRKAQDLRLYVRGSVVYLEKRGESAALNQYQED